MQEIFGILGLAFTLIALVWGLSRYINSRVESLRKETKADQEVLHARVNDIRNEYVHGDHLDKFLDGINKSVGNFTEEQRRTNTRIDSVLNHLAGVKTSD